MIPSLNGLRAVSILLVLAGHAAMCSGFESWWLGTYTYAGVIVFFVVSGYLITTLMLREAEQTGSVNVRAFYLRRAWRILPVAYAYLGLITLVQGRHFSWSDIALTWTYLTSYGVSFSQHFPWDLDHLWSLSVEEQFYLLWPLVFTLGVRWIKGAAWAGVLIAPVFRYFSIHGGYDKAALFAFPGVVDSIATGCLIALYAGPLKALVNRHSRYARMFWLVALGAPSLMAIDSAYLWPLPQLLGHGAWSLFNVSVGVGILWAIQAKPLVLNNRLTNWLGAISYSLYIWHMPFMNPQAGIPFPLNVILGFLAAVTSYYLLEQPILEYRDRWKRGGIAYTRIADSA